MVTLAENRYGKSLVRLVRVKRHADRHDFREWQVEVLLQGDFASCFEAGDNSKILATDTMKNAVYSLACDSSADSMETFAMELIDFLLGKNPQVSRAEVTIQEKAWKRLSVQGKPHPTTFVNSSGERQTTTISRSQGGAFLITAGLENLVIMKTAGSAFEGFIRDPLTTLEESSDRLFGTALRANWTYQPGNLDFLTLRARIREILLETFANHESKSVQHTLYAMAARVLESISQMEDIELTMPNKHCLLVDLSRFGRQNPNEIFVPVDEPHGYIQARVTRQR
ncbi:MAG TPA: urate oxidase [Candidatus Eremiobacteraceae bacterium]|nr:urate oxidase [Candidatus Eremiobacteraceae bacterium]